MISKAPDRNATIDSLRGISILLVLAFHYLVRWAPPLDNDNLYHFSGHYSASLELGKFGVYFFFVISGLVISLTIERSRTVAEFAVRRFSRLYPALICASLLTLIAMSSFGPRQFQRGAGDFFASLFMLPSLSGKIDFFSWIDGAYWSLAVEIKFYLIVAISHVLLRDRYWIGVASVGIMGIIIEPFALGVADKILINEYIAFFMWGIAIYYAQFRKQFLVAAVNSAVALIIFSANASFLQLSGGFAWTAVLFVGSGCVMMAAAICFEMPLSWAPLTYIGRISYSLYLIHQNIGVTIIGKIKAAGNSDLAAVFTALLFSVVIASAMFHWIELPMQDAIRRWYASLLSRRAASTDHTLAARQPNVVP
jgi:peptidoglycan/LPS O-acetylase OafA/YrhL